MKSLLKTVRTYTTLSLLILTGSASLAATSVHAEAPPPATNICVISPTNCTTNNNGSSTLSVSVRALPSDTGVAPLAVNFENTAEGTASGTINYTGWFNCDQPGTDIPTLINQCGDPHTPSLGFKVDGTNQNPLTEPFTYPNAGSFMYKVVVERGTASPAESRVPITVSTPTLTLQLSASATNGLAPFSPTITHAVDGTAVGTINYSIWFNCADAGTSVAAVTTVCGDPNDPNIGHKVDGTTLNPFLYQPTYNQPGTYSYKAIAERGGAAPVESRLTLTVSTNVPNTGVQLFLNGSSLPQVFDNLGSGQVSVNLPFTWVRQPDSHNCILTRKQIDQGVFSQDLPADPFDDGVSAFATTITFSDNELTSPYPIDFVMTCGGAVQATSTVRATFQRDSASGGTPTPTPSPTGNVLNYSHSSRQW